MSHRDDDVQQSAERFRLGEAEDAAGTPVSSAYDALGVDNSIRNARNETVRELCWVDLHVCSHHRLCVVC
jgi:hypothetical protein